MAGCSVHAGVAGPQVYHRNMRSPAEVSFRLRQELADVRMLLAPPRIPEKTAGEVRRLPDPVAVARRLRGTACAQEIESLAEGILSHRFPVLGATIDTGPAIDWRRDYVHGISSGPAYFRLVPYLDFARVGDHKVIWELNRHQHLVLLGQAWLITGRAEFLKEAWAQLESWMEANPFLRGINWTSALEVAFRALSWMWLWHFAGAEMDAGLRRRFLTGLYRHGCFLESNLSVYFSPNTHLLGEAAALHALGAVFPEFPARWERAGAELVETQMRAQVRADGGHFEQSTYYHVYALDMFLLHAALGDPRPDYREGLARMAGYLAAISGPAGMPFLGDDDGGRLFHPYGDRSRFGRATLATCSLLPGRDEWPRDPAAVSEQAAWWLGERALGAEARTGAPRSCLFPDTGTAVMAAGGAHILIKAGPFGPGSGGHSHADVLSFTASLGGEEILIDPGTCTYVSDAALREAFRGTAAHNTITVDGRSQAVSAGPFRWGSRPETEIREWVSTEEHDYLDALCRYAGFVHRRRWLFVKPAVLFVVDEVTGPAGTHLVEQWWHGGSDEPGRRLALAGSAERVEGWRSRVLGAKEPAPVWRVAVRGNLPAVLGAAVDLSAEAGDGASSVTAEQGAITLRLTGRRPAVVRFEANGEGRYEAG